MVTLYSHRWSSPVGCDPIDLFKHRRITFIAAAPLDFIERHLGFSPDAGDGSMEVLLITVLVMIVTVAGFRWASK